MKLHLSYLKFGDTLSSMWIKRSRCLDQHLIRGCSYTQSSIFLISPVHIIETFVSDCPILNRFYYPPISSLAPRGLNMRCIRINCQHLADLHDSLGCLMVGCHCDRLVTEQSFLQPSPLTQKRWQRDTGQCEVGTEGGNLATTGRGETEYRPLADREESWPSVNSSLG